MPEPLGGGPLSQKEYPQASGVLTPGPRPPAQVARRLAVVREPLGRGTMSKPGHQRWRAGFLKRSLCFLCRRKHYWRVERANRVHRALAPICKPGVAEAAAENYYRGHTGNEGPRSIDDAILEGIYGDRAVRKRRARDDR
jgi:hypothetical protein